MLKEKMNEALCEQINAELYSSYLYLSMSAYFETINLRGAASWMRTQAQEELLHVGKFFDYIHDRGGKVTLGAIDAPPAEWKSPLAAFEQAYEHEQHVTERVNSLVDLANELSDRATYQMLQWFVAEQVEEEASVDAVVQHIKLVGGEGHGLFLIDRELATRTFVMPPADGAGA
ncbi:MAG: ferritin [Deltaproteobacteria bacterium]|jgi:ferritin|nr:ferritin [Deltaproteobacteria bacterium]MBW2537551.1 ferritin [Deltaproteobacteria bacterium]